MERRTAERWRRQRRGGSRPDLPGPTAAESGAEFLVNTAAFGAQSDPSLTPLSDAASSRPGPTRARQRRRSRAGVQSRQEQVGRRVHHRRCGTASQVLRTFDAGRRAFRSRMGAGRWGSSPRGPRPGFNPDGTRIRRRADPRHGVGFPERTIAQRSPACPTDGCRNLVAPVQQLLRQRRSRANLQCGRRQIEPRARGRPGEPARPSGRQVTAGRWKICRRVDERRRRRQARRCAGVQADGQGRFGFPNVSGGQDRRRSPRWPTDAGSAFTDHGSCYKDVSAAVFPGRDGFEFRKPMFTFPGVPTRRSALPTGASWYLDRQTARRRQRLGSCPDPRSARSASTSPAGR